MSAVSPKAVVDEIDRAIAAVASTNVSRVRAVRRSTSTTLRAQSPAKVFAVADLLLARDRDYDRFIAYELIAHHDAALDELSASRLRRLGDGMDSWGDVDTFACYLSGVAWRNGAISDAEVKRWSHSPDRWWRRAALVSTVPLNLKARGGSGDAARTLAACDWLIDDRDPMVVKALSWALRTLIPRDPRAVERYVQTNAERLPALALRETRTKLRTGLKNPRR
jgi:3-methyladenine DNA glycosylase AlkD